MPEPETRNQATCPVCGQGNNCALANPATATQPCWCYSATFDALALTHPAAVRNRNTCLCPQCAQADQAADSDAT